MQRFDWLMAVDHAYFALINDSTQLRNQSQIDRQPAIETNEINS